MNSNDADNAPVRRRLPPWLKRRIPAGAKLHEVTALLEELKLTTVCDGAHCPNRGECFARGTATFMILGERCTRNCRFCAVEPGQLPPPRADEPQAVAEACRRLSLRYVVITSVTRDDLPDGGAHHFARTIDAVRRVCGGARIEVLTPDFQGDTAAIDTVLAAHPDVFNHNVETVGRLYGDVRPQADYRRSLDVLAYVGRRGGDILSKSGLMVGLGERPEEIREVMHDLRRVGCDILTIGQYLAPSPNHYPVARFVEPSEFDLWRREGEALGFAAVAAGPFVRSSYNAEHVFTDAQD
ncbi:MAG: lipoyl synthase [Planctomycetes bacterium]|nr:lipoyl synthase [Planctomycetota bacterium]